MQLRPDALQLGGAALIIGGAAVYALAPTQTPSQRHGGRRHRGYTTTGVSEVDSEDSFNNQSRSGSISRGASNGEASSSHVVAAAPSANARASAADSDDSFNAGAAPGPSGKWRAGPK